MEGCLCGYVCGESCLCLCVGGVGCGYVKGGKGCLFGVCVWEGRVVSAACLC